MVAAAARRRPTDGVRRDPSRDAARPRAVLGPVGPYLKVERLATLQEKQLAKAQGRNYAGSWIERGGNGQYKLVVATTSIRPQKGPAGVEIRNARHTPRRSERLQGRSSICAWRKAPRCPRACTAGTSTCRATASWSASARAGRRPARLRRRQRRRCPDRAFRRRGEQPTVRATLKGGLGTCAIPGDGYLYACSIGFNVTKGTTPGYRQRRHCGDAGEPVYLEGSAGTGPQWTLGPQIGTFQASTFPNPGRPVTTVVGRDLRGPHPVGDRLWLGQGHVTVKGSTAVAVGAAICRSGRTSGWRCGTIKATGRDRQLQSGETILNLTRTYRAARKAATPAAPSSPAPARPGRALGGSGNCKGGGRRSRSLLPAPAPLLSAYGHAQDRLIQRRCRKTPRLAGAFFWLRTRGSAHFADRGDRFQDAGNTSSSVPTPSTTVSMPCWR